MSRYAEAHASPQGPGDARPTAQDIIKDEGAEGTLKGEVIVITGTSSGIGVETARALATTGASLFVTARDVNKARAALVDVVVDPSARMEIVEMDQVSLESVRTAAATILAKTANIYLANEIERRHGANHLHATSVHPGIIQTGLTQHMPPEAFKGMEHLFPTMKSVEQGASTSVWAAVGKAWEHAGGKYLVDCDVAVPYTEGDPKMSAPGYAPWAYDVDEAKRLWRDSLKLVGLPEEE